MMRILGGRKRGMAVSDPGRFHALNPRLTKLFFVTRLTKGGGGGGVTTPP